MICNNEVANGAKIVVMPDVHPGKVGPIGLTMTIQDRVIPNLLGVDIGCCVICAKLNEKKVEFQKLDTVIRDNIPAGTKIRNKPLLNFCDLENLYCINHIDYKKANLSFGTLGGGNHFIEIGNGMYNGEYYLIIHTGSRHLGVEVTNYYVSEGAKLLKEKGEEVPYEMTYLEADLMRRYIYDVRLVQKYAEGNAEAILKTICKYMKFKFDGWYYIPHNYIDSFNGEDILRKGAISARSGEHVVIPINMRDGVILGEGLGNPYWNFSAPHGAGRLYSRSEVKNHFTVSAFKKEMKGVYSSCIGSGTLDEAPFAYRDIDYIKEAIKDTVEITDILKPVYNFKSGN